jgi:hypothetical protein
MTCEVGSLVKWTEATPTRLGYKLSAIGKVVGVHDCPSRGQEVDVEFEDGDVVRGAFARWFEPAPREASDEDGEGRQPPPADA